VKQSGKISRKEEYIYMKKERERGERFKLSE